MSQADYYAILGIERSASAEEIRLAIREQRRRWTRHQGHPNLERRYEAELQVRALTDIEATLVDTRRRAEYDARLPLASPDTTLVQQQGDDGPHERVDLPPTLEQDWVSIAETELSSGRWKEAHDAAARATASDPARREGWRLRVMASLQLDETQAARHEAQQLLDLGPTTAEQWSIIAAVQASDERWEEAAVAYVRAAQLDGSDPMHAAGEADMYCALGQPSRALPILERIVSENPRRVELQDQLAAALLEDTFSRWTTEGDDSFLDTDEQFQHTEQVLKRVRGMRVINEETHDRLKQISVWFAQGGTDT